MTRKNMKKNMKKNKAEMEGGKRKRAGTKRRLSPALAAWNKKVMEAFKAGRAKNPNFKLKDAMKAAKKQK